MPAPSTPADEIVTLTQLAESYHTMAHVGVHYTAQLLSEVRRSERLLESLRDRLAVKDARIAELEAEIARYTASQVAGSEAA